MSHRPLLIHAENITRIPLVGRRLKRWLTARARQIAAHSTSDPDVTILIRTRNDGAHIRRLLADIQAQVFDGAVEIIVVDTESRDDTALYAREHGARVITMTQQEFTYPRALNRGFKAASHPWVVTLVGHSSLNSPYFLKSIGYWMHRHPKLAGIYGVTLTNWNASIWERLQPPLFPRLWKRPQVVTELSVGIMAANCAIVRRDAWRQLGGYDERYAGGGEDRAFAEAMLGAGMTIVREPLCSVYHSHGLGFANSVRQWRHWVEVAHTPVSFNTNEVHRRRPDLR